MHNACLNALDGSEDTKITRDLQSSWKTFGMSEIRDQLRAEVRSEVEAGRLHSFWQYKELLEPYDDHPGYLEGMEGAPVDLDDDDEDGRCSWRRGG